jgi:hypothetical protein
MLDVLRSAKVAELAIEAATPGVQLAASGH